MSRTRSIRQRLLADHVLLILLLGGAILATTFVGARRAVETLSRGIVGRAADQAESELRRFFADRPGIAASLAEPETNVDQLVDDGALLDELSRFSRGIEVSERGSVWVLTDDRRLLAWPDDPRLWAGRDPAEALLRSPRELGLTLVDDAAEALAGRSPEALGEPVRFASGGEDWWAAGRRFELSGPPAPLRGDDGRALLIAVAVPHADLLGDREELRRRVLLLTGLALLAAVVRAAVVARRFSRPIEALVADSDRISQGDLEPGRPIATGLAEVHRLADAHERMRRGLKTLMKLERDLQVARQIQQNTFPRELPELPGFDLVAWSRPADETGGDSYDVIGLDADGALVEDRGGDPARAVLMLADATGHGIGPALSVTQLRAMLRMAVRMGSGLAEVAERMNLQLHADLPGNRFITAWLGELTVDGATLATFSAGQAPLLLYRAASDEVEVMNADVPPLGLLPAIPILAPPPVALAPGDVYAVLSDGFFEAADASGMEFGTERITEVLRRSRRSSAQEILAALRAAVREFTGDAPPDDDRTAVIVKRRSHRGRTKVP